MHEDSAQIRTAIDRYLEAVRSKDLHRVMSCYARDIVAFDLAPPLRQNCAAYQKLWNDAFVGTEGPFEIDIYELEVSASGDLGVAWGLEHVVATPKHGPSADMWLRWTASFRRVDGAWRIVHEHTSAPIDFLGNRPLFDQVPA